MPAGSYDFDFLVIGGGPGGYVAAIRAAQLGLKTACVERGRTLGGTCLNVGCIPSKALLDSTELFHQVRHKAERHGIRIAGAEMDVPAMMARKDSVVSTLTRGVEGLFRKTGIEWIHGSARLEAPDRVRVEGMDRPVTAETVVIATGSAPASLPGITVDEDRILSSTGALALTEPPEHLVVIGGGVIGMELGSVWLRLGSRVTVLEWTDSLLPGMDAEVVRAATASYRKQGFTLRTGVRVLGVETGKDGAQVQVEGGDPIEADRVLVAVGRVPYTTGLGAEEIGVRFGRRGVIEVDGNYHTGLGRLYAIGDAIGGLMLAHKAMEEGSAVAEIAAGKPGRVDYDAVASVVYTWPEVAAVGKTESQLQQEGRKYIAGKFPFAASGRARAMDETEGMVKVLADAETHRLLGVHMVGPRTSDLISEASLAVEFQAAADDIALSVHAHPTLPEALKEAALAALGRAIHI